MGELGPDLLLQLFVAFGIPGQIEEQSRKSGIGCIARWRMGSQLRNVYCSQGMLTGYDQDDRFVGELFESHTLARFLVLMIEKEFEDIGGPVPRLLERNATVYLVIDVFAESLVGSDDGQKKQGRQAPLFHPGLRPELFESQRVRTLCTR